MSSIILKDHQGEYGGGLYLWWRKRLMWGTEKYAPGHSYPFISFLIPFLTLWIVGSFMGPVGGALWGIIGSFLIIISAVFFFIVASLDPGMNPVRRFSGHAKYCMLVTFRYQMHFLSSGYLQYKRMEHWEQCFGMKAHGTHHCPDWGLCIRFQYHHSVIFMKWIGQRNMHFYLWWLIIEIFKHFFLIIMWFAGWAFNPASGVIFLFLNIGIIVCYALGLINAI